MNEMIVRMLQLCRSQTSYFIKINMRHFSFSLTKNFSIRFARYFVFGRYAFIRSLAWLMIVVEERAWKSQQNDVIYSAHGSKMYGKYFLELLLLVRFGMLVH